MAHRRTLHLIVLLLVAAATAGPTVGCARESPDTMGGGTRSPPVEAAEATPPPADVRRWWATEMLTRACMASEGFDDYRAMPAWGDDPGPHSGEEWLATLTDARRDRARSALFGDVDAPGWQRTGCYGRALHDMGTD